jgi:glutathione S-transferase
MSIILYHGEPNGPSLTVLAALAETNITAHRVYIDLAQAERHNPVVPRSVEVDMSIEGEGPVLVVGGVPMSDSVFIARYCNDVGTGNKIVPTDSYERWQMMAWCRYIIERVAPAAAFLGTQIYLSKTLAALDDDAFSSILASIKNDDLKQRWQAVQAGDFPEELVSDSTNKIVAAIEKIEAQLHDRDWLMGDFTIADLETYAWIAGMREVLPLAFTQAPKTIAWLGRVEARPSVIKALACASMENPQRSWAPGPEINRWG